MRKKRMLLCGLALCMLLCGCNGTDGFDAPEAGSAATDTPPELSLDFAATEEEMFTERDREETFSAESCVQILLQGDRATASSDSVQIEGSVVQITAEATYLISGTLTNGQIIVNTPDTAKPRLILSGASIHSESSAPLYILGADKVFVTLAPQTENTLSTGESFVAIDENNIDGALFSKQDLTINGTGKLTISSPSGHGIVCKDDLVLTGGEYHVTAAAHALDANDSIRISGVTLQATAGKDGLHAENSEDTAKGFIYLASGSLQLNVDGDGVDASAFLQLEGGEVNVVAGGGVAASGASDVSKKGLKATASILINGGRFVLDCADDAVHANTSIAMNGGEFEISTGDDGFHADETLAVTAGKIRITKSYEGLEALDISVSGGEISLVATDDGLNAAGGTDQSGFGGFGGGKDQFGRPGGGGRPDMGGGNPGMGGGMSSASDGSILISGGSLYVQASGDGLDANGTLSITGGHVTVCGPTVGDTATLDYDVSGSITGGTFIGTGAAGMAQSFSNATQGVIAVRVGTQSANTVITVTDGEGNVILTHTPALSFAVVILSSPQLVKDNTYKLTIGSISEDVEAS